MTALIEIGPVEFARAAPGQRSLFPEPKPQTAKGQLLLADTGVSDQPVNRPKPESSMPPEVTAPVQPKALPGQKSLFSQEPPSQFGHVTETPAFKQWHEGSHVVDATGKPLLVYKAMNSVDWTKSTGRRGKDAWNMDADDSPPIESINRPSEFPAFHGDEPGIKIAGFFGGKEISNKFAANPLSGMNAIYPAYLSLKNPYIHDAQGANAGDVQFGASGKPFRDALRSGRHDGAIIRNTADEGDIYVAMHPHQIKSPFNKTFDPNDARLNFSRDFGPVEFSVEQPTPEPIKPKPPTPPQAFSRIEDIGPVEFSFDESKHPRFKDNEENPYHRGEFAPANGGNGHELDADDARRTQTAIANATGKPDESFAPAMPTHADGGLSRPYQFWQEAPLSEVIGEIPQRPAWLRKKPHEGPWTEAHENAQHAADKWDVDVNDVVAQMPHAATLQLEYLMDRERAKAEARRQTGLTARHEYADRDWSSFPRFDETSREFSQEHPELGFGNDDDTPPKVWDFVREGKQKLPDHEGREIADLAASMLAGNRARQRPAPVTEDDPIHFVSDDDENDADDWNYQPAEAGDATFDPSTFSRSDDDDTESIAERMGISINALLTAVAEIQDGKRGALRDREGRIVGFAVRKGDKIQLRDRNSRQLGTITHSGQKTQFRSRAGYVGGSIGEFSRSQLPVPQFGEALSADHAKELAGQIRDGQPDSKNGGRPTVRIETGPMVMSRIPTNYFDDVPDEDYGNHTNFLRSTTNPDRVDKYAAMSHLPPINVSLGRGKHPHVSDGGHRLMAAIDRGDQWIDALVPPKIHKELHGEAQFSRDISDVGPVEFAIERETTAHDTKKPGEFAPHAHILKTMDQIEPGARNGALVSCRELRKNCGMAKPDFDRTVYELAVKHQLSAHAHDFATSLEPHELDELVDTAHGDPTRAEIHPNHGRYWVGVAFNRNTPQEFSRHEYSSTQLNIDDAGYSRADGSPMGALKELADAIPDSELADDGRESHFHITTLFGLTTDKPNEVRNLVADFGPVELTLGKTSIFPAKEGKDYDVVKIDIEGEDIHRLNKLLKTLDHESTHPRFVPHLTICYVKKGLGAKYVGDNDLTGASLSFDILQFSNKDREHTAIPLDDLGEDMIAAQSENADGPVEFARPIKPSAGQNSFGWSDDEQEMPVSSSNVASIAFEANGPNGGNLLVRFLNRKKDGPGTQYRYFTGGKNTFNEFKNAAMQNRSVGSLVWDRLRVRKSVAGHQVPFEVSNLDKSGYVPRAAGLKRGMTGEWFNKRTVNGKESTLAPGPVRQSNGPIKGYDPSKLSLPNPAASAAATAPAAPAKPSSAPPNPAPAIPPAQTPPAAGNPPPAAPKKPSGLISRLWNMFRRKKPGDQKPKEFSRQTARDIETAYAAIFREPTKVSS